MRQGPHTAHISQKVHEAFCGAGSFNVQLPVILESGRRVVKRVASYSHCVVFGSHGNTEKLQRSSLY